MSSSIPTEKQKIRRLSPPKILLGEIAAVRLLSAKAGARKIMFPAERHSQILSLLDQHGRVRVTDLARTFQVTEETVRRDLERLELEGRLQRTHGGAMPGQTRREQPFAVRQASQLGAKTAIARAAVTLIEADQVIALDGSTSALAMAGLLPEMATTVVTNSLPVVAALDYSQVRVMGIGGVFDHTSRCFVGPLAAHALERINIHTVFLSCVGVDLERGLSESLDELAAVKRSLINRAERVVLLVDHSKFGIRSTMTFATLAEVDVVITDAQVDPQIIAQLRSLGLSVQLAESH